jgi:hypothetical protein
VRWHRAGFRCYWRWKSRPLGGRPQIETKLRALIRRMSMENPLWGAPRIHGELLKLGFEVAQSSVAKYMVKRRGPPSQGWRTFVRNHAPDIAGMDLFVVPTIGFDLLYAFVIVRLDRRDLGIAVLQTFLSKREQYHSNVVTQSVSMLEQATRTRIQALTQYFVNHGVLDLADASHRAVVAIGQIVQKQAFVLAFSDTFYLLGVTVILALMATLLLRKPGHLETGGAH